MKLRMRNLFMIAALLLLSSGCSTKTPPANEPVKEESSGQETDIKSETDENDEKEPGGNDGPDLSENDGPELSSAQETAQNHQDYEEEGREVALVTDVSYVMDHGFNEAAFQGIQKYADAFELTGALGSAIGSYSHGMKQKLAVISALMRTPKLLILDEPFVGLDPQAAFVLKGFLHELCGAGGAVIFSTHVLEVAEKLCSRIAIIQRGKLVKIGETAAVVGDESLEQVFLELAREGGTHA